MGKIYWLFKEWENRFSNLLKDENEALRLFEENLKVSKDNWNYYTNLSKITCKDSF